MLLWGMCYPLIAAGIAYAPHLTFAASRAFLAGLTLTGLALVLCRPLPKGTAHWSIVATVGFGATALGFLGMFHAAERSEEHTSELQSLMRISYAVFCLKKKKNNN